MRISEEGIKVVVDEFCNIFDLPIGTVSDIEDMIEYCFQHYYFSGNPEHKKLLNRHSDFMEEYIRVNNL